MHRKAATTTPRGAAWAREDPANLCGHRTGQVPVPDGHRSPTFTMQIVDGLITKVWRNAADLQRLFHLGARILPPAPQLPYVT